MSGPYISWEAESGVWNDPTISWKAGMTVCAAALARFGEAVVLVSDKAVACADNRFQPAVQRESGGIEKRLAVGTSGRHMLIAGHPTAA